MDRSKLAIFLNKTDPLERLKEFCEQGKYRYTFFTHKFANGYFMTCEISDRNDPIISETCWIEDTDLRVCEKIISANLLVRIGLGCPETPEEAMEQTIENTVQHLQEMMSGNDVPPVLKDSVNMISQLISKQDVDQSVFAETYKSIGNWADYNEE